MDFSTEQFKESVEQIATVMSDLVTTYVQEDGGMDIGEIEQGKRADLILFTMEGNEMVIKKTFVAGELVYSKN